MKYIYLSACLFFFSVTALPTFAADWSLISRGNAQTFRSVSLDGSKLVAVGNKGSVFLSADNGNTWTASATNATSWLFAEVLLPNADLMAVGENGMVITSSDHAKTWAQVNLGVTGNMLAISSKNQTGYIVGENGIYLTRNGSTNTWNTSTLGTTDHLYGVQDLGDGTGWAVGANGDIFHLTLNGSSYTKIAVTTKEALRAVTFSDAKTGWIVGTQGTVLHSTDSGMTWAPVSISGVTSQTLYAITSSGNRLAIAGDKILMTSEDAGNTWNVKSFANTLDAFYSITFAPDDSVIAVGTDYDVASLVYKMSSAPVVVPVPVPTPVPVIPGTVSQGSLIKLACSAGATVNDPCKAVYFYATDGKRHAFTNDKVYFTWFTDFSTVKDVSADFLASLTLGRNVTYRPGVKMVKFQTSPQVYVVAKGGVLRAVASESIAAALYGINWNTKIDDISDVFYRNYTFGTPVVMSSDYDPAQARIMVGSISENF